MDNQTYMYIGGGALAGYYLAPSLPGGLTPMMAAVAGAVAGYVLDSQMK